MRILNRQNRIESGRPSCRKDAKEGSSDDSGDNRSTHNLNRNNWVYRRQSIDESANEEAKTESHRNAHQTQYHAFGQKKAKDRPSRRTRRHPNSDFRRSLADAEQHHVHDPNSTDEKRNRGQPNEEPLQDVGKAVDDL